MWKGAISFGLVNIPVALYSATRSSGIDFDWLDRRTMDPVGYKRVNKKTGKEVASDDIVRGVEYEHDRYVVLTDDEIESAYPRTTQTIELEAFVDADEIPFVYLERPYYIAPADRGEKVYALLREALRKSNRVAVARVVIHTKQHLAMLMPCGRSLVLNLMRWGGEVRSSEELNLPPAGEKAAGLREAEMKMALQLVEDMTQKWDAHQFRNSFSEEIRKLVETKAREGEVEVVEEEALQPDAGAESNVVDLTRLLRRSLQGRHKEAAEDETTKRPRKSATGRPTAPSKASPRRAAAGKKAAAASPRAKRKAA
nr:Ku protein [Pulveribacter suum]